MLVFKKGKFIATSEGQLEIESFLKDDLVTLIGRTVVVINKEKVVAKGPFRVVENKENVGVLPVKEEEFKEKIQKKKTLKEKKPIETMSYENNNVTSKENKNENSFKSNLNEQKFVKPIFDFQKNLNKSSDIESNDYYSPFSKNSQTYRNYGLLNKNENLNSTFDFNDNQQIKLNPFKTFSSNYEARNLRDTYEPKVVLPFNNSSESSIKRNLLHKRQSSEDISKEPDSFEQLYSPFKTSTASNVKNPSKRLGKDNRIVNSISKERGKNANEYDLDNLWE